MHALSVKGANGRSEPSDEANGGAPGMAPFTAKDLEFIRKFTEVRGNGA